MTHRPITPRSLVTVLAAALLFAALSRLLLVSTNQLTSPFDLSFESPNLSTVKAIRAGENVYAESMFDDVPFNITIYTPLYHFLISLLPMSDENPFFFGRLTAAVFMLAAAGSLFFVAKGKGAPAFAMLAAGAFFLVRPMVSNAAYLKNDTMALAASAAAVVVASRARRRRSRIMLCAVLCAVALGTKQSFVSAAVACFVFFVAQDLRCALLFGGLLGGLGVAGVATARALWGPGFWFSVVTAVRNPMDWQQVPAGWRAMGGQPVFCFLVAATLVVLAVSLWRERRGVVLRSPFALYTFVAWALCTLTLPKLGSSLNYFLEPVLASCLMLTHSARTWSERRAVDWRTLVPVGLLCVMAIAELSYDNRKLDVSFLNRKVESMYRAFHVAARQKARELGGPEPKVLNFVAPRITYEFADQAYLNDPYHYSLLWQDGKLSNRSLIAAIERRTFDLVLLPEYIPVPPQLEEIRQAVVRHYVLREVFAGICLFVIPPPATVGGAAAESGPGEDG